MARLQRTLSRVTGPVTPGVTAKDLQGAWKTRWTGTIGERPKMIDEMLIDFKVDGNGLTGAYRGLAGGLPDHGCEDRLRADFLYGDGTYSLVNRDTNPAVRRRDPR